MGSELLYREDISHGLERDDTHLFWNMAAQIANALTEMKHYI